MANILDLLGSYQETVSINSNISLLYIGYQVLSFNELDLVTIFHMDDMTLTGIAHRVEERMLDLQ